MIFLTENFEHYYTQSPSSELKTRDVQLKLGNGHTYGFKSPSGVFGYGKTDRASKLLIEKCRLHGKTLLDLGCGFGMIGITLKKEFPHLKLFMSDINERAVEFAKINSKNNNIEATVKQGNIFEPWDGYKFDNILCNPPIAAGKKVWMDIIDKSRFFLEKEGVIQIVAFHNKGGSRILDYMRNTFSTVKTFEKSGGIRIYAGFGD